MQLDYEEETIPIVDVWDTHLQELQVFDEQP